MGKDFRITPARKAMLDIFSDVMKPLSVKTISSILPIKGIAVNKTTIYRELSFLIRKGLIKEVYTDPAKIHYESSSLEHHHHLVCTGCGSIDDFKMEGDLTNAESNILRSKKFKVTDHSLEFFGFCANCQNK